MKKIQRKHSPSSKRAKHLSKAKKAGQKVKEHGQDVAPVIGDFALNAGKAVWGAGVLVAGFGADAAAPGSGAGVSAAAGSIEGMCRIGVQIAEQVYKAHVNKKQSVRLGEKVTRVCTALMGLEKYLNTDNYIDALLILKDTLTKIQHFLEIFSSRGWFKRVLLAGVDSEKFQDLTKELFEHSQELNLGLSAQSFFNISSIF